LDVARRSQICAWPFASGLNNAGEVIGFARAGIPPGVTVLRLQQGKWRRNCGAWADEYNWVDRKSAHCTWAVGQVLKRSMSPVFIDSGAYSVIGEMEKGRDAPKMRQEEWDIVLVNYVALALSQGTPGLLWPVLPDEIGSQAGTFRQIKRYLPEITDILRAKVNAIAVMHSGRLSRVDYASKVADTLHTDKFVLGFPVVGGRTTPEELAETIDRLDIRPLGVHLLGISPQSRDWWRFVKALAELPRGMSVSCDAVMHRPLLKRTEFYGPLTRQQDEVRHVIEDTVRSQRRFKDPLLRPDFQIRSELAIPSLWLSKSERAKIIEAAIAEGLVQRAPYKRADVKDYNRYAGDPDWAEDEFRRVYAKWYHQHKLFSFYEHPTEALLTWVGPDWQHEPMASWMAGKLQEAYLRTLGDHTSALRKEQAIRRHFTGQKPNRLLRPNEALSVEPACFALPRMGQMELVAPAPLALSA
jgi:hypothetical protein